MIEFLVCAQLLEVFPHYHQWMPTMWEIDYMQGKFRTKTFHRDLRWVVEGRDFDSEEIDFGTTPPTIRLSAARLGLKSEIKFMRR